MQQSYNAINASAGSGKTYALVQRILMLCLKFPNQEESIKHILALTFTNKAANEMKERLLSWLKSFSQEDYAENRELKNLQEALKKQGIKVDLEELHLRSKKVLTYILHHYSNVNIVTIDKFNAKLVRSFSQELGLAQQFNVEIQTDPLIIEAVDKMLDEIGENFVISEAFMDFMNYNLDNEERPNVNKSLYKSAKEFVKDIHYHELKSNASFNWEAYETTKQNLRTDIAHHRKEAIKIVKDSLELIKINNLETSDFYQGNRGGIGIFFKNVLDFYNNKRDKFPIPENEENAIANYRKLSASKDPILLNTISSIIESLIENRSEIINHYISSEKKDKILRELLPLKINKEIQEKLKEIEVENDLVLLSKFNVLINEHLKNEPSEFIYEKIGNQFQHYFFDEFQDTSKMQWDNFIPLRNHSISMEEGGVKNSFTLVGDPKQSIYRFRGGNSEIMLDILNKKENTVVEVNVEVLEHNYRSAKNIVDFNNNLYYYISEHLEPEHQKLFRENAHQIPEKDFLGRVKVNLIDYSNKNIDFFQPVADKMHQDIQECLDQGFQFSDLCILCRYSNEIQKLSQLLSLKKVTYNGENVYIKTISDKGLTLNLSNTIKAVIQYLYWELYPKNHQYLVKMLYYLNDIGRIKMQDFSKETLELLELKNKDKIEKEILKRYQLNLKEKDQLHFNLYNYIEYFVKEFSVEHVEPDYLLYFLETLYNFTQNTGANLKDFLNYWEEESKNIALQHSENTDAINFLTIHAAKGLEFPVVFLPMKNANKDDKFSDWFIVEDHQSQDLKSIHLEGFNKNIATYDSNANAFNTEHQYQNKIDRFCLDYVATTRAVEQLFLYLQKPSKPENNKNEIYAYLKTINDTDDVFDVYPEVNQSYKKQNFSTKTPKNTVEIKNWTNIANSTKNISIATPSKNYQNTVETVRIGILTHEILSQIISQKDVEKTLERYLLEGTITKKEKEEISTRILNIINDENYAKYFKENLKVINEKDIMITENHNTKIYRPDRLISTEKGFYIIDFKTGVQKEEYQKQLDTYKKVLEKLGRTVLETQVIYI